MSLRLVSDNAEPRTATELAAQIREFADAVEAGGLGAVTRIAAAVEYEGGLTIEAWGDHTSPYEMMGLFEAAKLMTFADAMPPDAAA